MTDRLITPPISLPPSLIQSLDMIVFLTKMKYRGRYVRKTENVLEITGFDFEKNRPTTNSVFKWNPETDKIAVFIFSISPKSFYIEDTTKILWNKNISIGCLLLLQ